MREHDIKFGVRPFHGPDRGRLIWRPAALGAVSTMLRNPAYAGTYAYGRFSEDPKGRRVTGKRKIRFVPMEEWQILIPNKFPGYITWEQYLENRERARQNRTTSTTRCSPRQLTANLLRSHPPLKFARPRGSGQCHLIGGAKRSILNSHCRCR